MINQKRKTANVTDYGVDLTEWAKSITLTVKPMKRKIKVILFTGKKGQTYFRILGGNNKTVACSEGYLSIKNAMKTVKLLQGSNDWLIKDETTKK